VLAFDEGSTPEIVEQGRTGFLVRDEQEMAAAVAQVAALDPRACREAACQWAPARIAAAYEEVYRGALRGDTVRDVRDVAATAA
jgi:glycosyltransferase involved in cell wall biosynthesis